MNISKKWTIKYQTAFYLFLFGVVSLGGCAGNGEVEISADVSVQQEGWTSLSGDPVGEVMIEVYEVAKKASPNPKALKQKVQFLQRILVKDTKKVDFSITPKNFPDSVLLLKAIPTRPYQTQFRAIEVANGKMKGSLNFIFSPTVLSGQVLSSGKPARDVDLWLYRDSQLKMAKPDFKPIFVANGLTRKEVKKDAPKDSKPLIHYGVMTDILGLFTFPIKRGDAKFQVKAAVTEKSKKHFRSKTAQLVVKSNLDNRIKIDLVSIGGGKKGGKKKGARIAGQADVSLSNDIMPIFLDNCDCHTGGSPAVGLNLSSAEMVIQTGVNVDATQASAPGYLLIKPFDSRAEPGGSFLVAKILKKNPGGGVLMPRNKPPLSQDEINLIRAWIDAGAPNN